jgi:hypothetical protein
MGKNMEVFCLEDSDSRRETFLKEFSQFANFTFCKNLKHINKEFNLNLKYDLLCLDHDLGISFKNNGTAFCKWLIKNYQYTDVPIIIHSHNPIAARSMAAILELGNFTTILRLDFKNLIEGWRNGYIGFLGHFKTDDTI